MVTIVIENWFTTSRTPFSPVYRAPMPFTSKSNKNYTYTVLALQCYYSKEHTKKVIYYAILYKVMPISNNIKGIISLIQSIFLVIGTSQYVQDPHSYLGLAIAATGAVIGAIKHWVDTQDNTTTTPGPATPQ